MTRFVCGVPIVDGKRRRRIPVLPEHIVGAIPGDAEHCPIAVAARACIRGLRGVAIDRGTVYLLFADRCEKYVLPDTDVAVIDDFDKTRSFPPGYRATLEPPTGNRREGARVGKSGTDKPRPRAKSIARHFEQSGRQFRMPTDGTAA